ncbi:MAG: cold-shock protein [Alphaproteobacteria bacterium]
MAVGVVKWFNPAKGYGFITPSNGGKDVFVHISDVRDAGIATLAEGQTVSFEAATDERGRQHAVSLAVSD